MAEYDFWDDRTVECNDNPWCIIADDYCYGNTNCSKCDRYVDEESMKNDRI